MRSRLLSLSAVLMAGCGLFRFQQERADILRTYFFFQGEVHSETPTDHPLIVFLLEAGDDGAMHPADRALVYGGGRYTMVKAGGSYAVMAFVDANEDLVFQSGERWGVARDGQAVDLNEDLDDVDVRIPARARPLEDMPFRVAGLDAGVSFDLDVVGELIELDDPRLSRRVGRLGLDQPLQYLRETRAGVYFLEPYDPRKIPVLMVHGLGGSPVEFEALIRGRPGLDGEPGFPGLPADRYQPWLVSYPSFLPVSIVADALHLYVDILELRHRPETVFLVGHSLGGLAIRAFLHERLATKRGPPRELFVSISTPWGGMTSAAIGAELSPIVVPAWRDLATGSAFLAGLHEPALPPRLPFHLVFPYPRPGGLSLPSGDGTVGFASLVYRPAVQEATAVHALEGSHAEILATRELATTLTGIFEETRASLR